MQSCIAAQFPRIFLLLLPCSTNLFFNIEHQKNKNMPVMLVMLMIVDGRMVEESERERSTLWGSHYDRKIRTRHGPRAMKETWDWLSRPGRCCYQTLAISKAHQKVLGDLAWAVYDVGIMTAEVTLNQKMALLPPQDTSTSHTKLPPHRNETRHLTSFELIRNINDPVPKLESWGWREWIMMAKTKASTHWIQRNLKGKVQTGKQADCMLVNAYIFNIQYPIIFTFNCIQ